MSSLPRWSTARPSARVRRPALGLAAICLGLLMISLDATIVNVALGPIVAGLGGTLSAAQWIAGGYALAFASLLLTAGALADRLGARTGFAIGLGAFALGSALCAAAPPMDVLIACRVLQGLGAAWLMPCSLALIAHTLPGEHERRRGLAIWGRRLGDRPGLRSRARRDPHRGDRLAVELPGQRAVALLVGTPPMRHVPETRRHAHRLDLPGQLLAIAALTSLTGGSILAGQQGWRATLPLVLFTVGLAGAAGLVAVERGCGGR
ncbi:MAG TPA: MFS transporter [Solirubrobacteraceae bacterium]|nr:MFS transporter [Solirubrobacteraceae bacterium]